VSTDDILKDCHRSDRHDNVNRKYHKNKR